MSLGNYKYTADDTTVYQVSVPDDFAIALSMVPASGAEPYLPAEISPRYATYISVAAGLTRQAVIKTTGQFASPPSPITVSGNSYKFRSGIGQKIPAIPLGVISTMSLLQGPPGPRGPGFTDGTLAGQIPIWDETALHWTNARLTPGANVTITNADGSITVASTGGGAGPTGKQVNLAGDTPIVGGVGLTILDSGNSLSKLLCWSHVTILNNTALPADYEVWITDDFVGATLAIARLQLLAGVTGSCALQTYFEQPGTSPMKTSVHSGSAGLVLKDSNGRNPATGMSLLYLT